MALWRCLACSAKYAVGLARCPQCHSTEHEEDGVAKITGWGGPSLGDPAAHEPAPAESGVAEPAVAEAVAAPAAEPEEAPAVVTVADQKAAGVPPEETVTVADQKAGTPPPPLPPAPPPSPPKQADDG